VIVVPPPSVEPQPEISSLTDRRKIAALEARAADLEHKLAAAMSVVKPSLAIERAGCHHFGVPLVSDRTPTVTCSDCGAALDPYEVLRKIAHREVNFCYQLNDLRAEARTLAAEVARLKAQRARLRRTAKAASSCP
jgi:hypothetical protein